MGSHRLMRLGVIGINHKLADLKLREQLAKACQRRFGASQSVHREHAVVLLSTCNRTEVYFSSHDLAETHTYLLTILRNDVEEKEFDHKLYSYFGIDCFSHLVRVTTGLDSAIIAETEIQGQVKAAYENTLEFRVLPKELHFLFQKSLGIAKKIRSELQLGRGMPNLEHAIFNTGKHFFKTLEEVRILFIGASEINQKILNYFKTKNISDITLCNRSVEHSQLLSEQLNVYLLEWSQLVSDWHTFDWIILGTKSPEYLITKRLLPSDAVGQKLIMDLCVPRNVEPSLGQDSRITLLNIDQLNRLLRIRNRNIDQSLSVADAMIFEASRQHISRYLQKEESRMAPLAVLA